LNKVFPDTFGNKHDLLFPCLQIMTNGTREEWEAAFQNAFRLLVGFPLHLESLENIHNNPLCCYKWHLNDLDGNFNFNGSVPAEQNHSSIAAHMGCGGNFAIAEHVKALVDRQIHLAKQRKSADDRLHSASERHKSSKAGSRGRDENAAQRVLSNFAFC
jgi:hypothetical protein